jgi:plasmid stabilization system protein ParE
MIDPVLFTPEADDDVVGAYDWYESREPGLGEDFLRSVEACVRGIQRHPEMYPAAIDEFRRAPIRRFPFEIFYEQRLWIALPSTLYFTAHKIHKSGASVSAIDTRDETLGLQPNCVSFRRQLPRVTRLVRSLVRPVVPTISKH